jgi:hypothetical protein
MSANSRQIGGSHYKKGGEEHWDRAWRLKYDPFQYIVTKWVERWRDKGGIQDLEKAAHALEKYIELAKAEANPINRDPTVVPTFVVPTFVVPTFHPTDVALNPTKPWPGRPFCTCELNGPIACPIHKDDGSHPGPGYVNQG